MNQDPADMDPKARAGLARARALSPERRAEIAKQAAEARWDPDLPTATHEGEFQLGESTVSCAVLWGDKRVITQATFLRALGRSRSPKAGTGVLSTFEKLPFFLSAEVFQPFISEDLREAAVPVFYRTRGGGKAVGYDARLLPRVAEVYLSFRDRAQQSGGVPRRYDDLVRAADLLMRGLANVGIIALVDEATGFQRDRARDALERILEQFIAKELRPWVHTFQSDFYENLFRLRGMAYPHDNVQRPRYFGHLTNNIVYARLAPKVLEELKRVTPRDSSGRHKHHLHRRLTEEVGHPKLREHLASVVSLMRISDGWKQFEAYLDRAHPKFNMTLQLQFTEPDTGIGL